MRSDGWMLRYLLNRNSPAGSWAGRDLAFWFDWTDDYISSNATIGRTGYDMNVSWNVSTGSDGDGSYINLNGNRDATTATGGTAYLNNATGVVFTQANSFTMKVRTKPITNAPNNSSWYFWSLFVAGITSDGSSWGRFKVGIRSWATTLEIIVPYTLSSLYDIYLVYDSITQKFFVYSNWVLQNAWGTAIPGNFTTWNLFLWDNWILAWNASSSNKYIYHAAIRNRALSQAEIDADIALWNTTKNDPSIVAYYIPDNLQYNTQYMLNPKALDQSPRSPTWTSSVVANTTVAPDWTTTADTLTIIWTATQGIEQPNTTITWSSLASKTFIIKAFVKVAAATALFRLKLTHWAVADYFSANQTATTTRQEFTFTQTFTSSTSWTWILCWIINNTTALNPILQVRNVRLFLVNETLRDESPNIGGYLWWKTQKVFSCWAKPNADFSDTPSSWHLMSAPRLFIQDRGPSHNLFIRYDDRRAAKTKVYTLWAWYRNKVHITWVFYWDNNLNKRGINTYINGVLAWWYSGTPTIDAPIGLNNSNLWLGRSASIYYQGNIRDARIYTFTWSFTDADALAIYNGGEPTSSGVTKYLHYKPPVGEVWTTTQDQSPNDRDWTLNGWVTRDYI